MPNLYVINGWVQYVDRDGNIRSCCGECDALEGNEHHEGCSRKPMKEVVIDNEGSEHMQYPTNPIGYIGNRRCHMK